MSPRAKKNLKAAVNISAAVLAGVGVLYACISSYTNAQRDAKLGVEAYHRSLENEKQLATIHAVGKEQQATIVREFAGIKAMIKDLHK